MLLGKRKSFINEDDVPLIEKQNWMITLDIFLDDDSENNDKKSLMNYQKTMITS